jgi:hypothetical protein
MIILVRVFGKQKWQARIFLRRVHFNARYRADRDRALSARKCCRNRSTRCNLGTYGGISLGLNNQVPIDGKVSRA